jgi:AraC-like DNA-binding protein
MSNYIMHQLTSYIHVKSLVSAFETVRESNFVFSGEIHNFWEMVFVLEGKIGVTRDDKIYILNSGEIIFHKPMEFHRLWSEGGNQARIMIFSFDTEGDGMKFLEDGVFKISLEEELLLKKILIEVENSFEIDGNSLINYRQKLNKQSVQLIKIYLEEFMLSVLNSNNAENVQKHSATSINYNIIINKMKENIYNSVTVKDIAKMCNLSVSNLKKIFKTYSGDGVIHYFNRMKINESKELLKTDLSIGEISDMLSYSGQNYFTVSFKRELGVSPLEYRRTKLL